MTKPEAAERAAKLRDQINDYRYQYHVLNRSTMSEAAADSLKHELSQLEAEYPDLITPDSPTQRVAGKPLAKFASVRHSAPMLSLNDVFSRDEVAAWVARVEKLAGGPQEYYAEIKMDGLAAALVYENGHYIQGLTRGDGATGEDVTPNLRTIEQVPLALRQIGNQVLNPNQKPGFKLAGTNHSSKPGFNSDQNLVSKQDQVLNQVGANQIKDLVLNSVYRGRFEVRGEVLLYKSVFAEFNAAREKAGKPLFANPRNTAAGAVRQLDPKLVAERRLSFHVYGVATEVPGITTHAAEHELARELGFMVEPHSQVLNNVDEIMAFADQWADKRKELPYGTDGLVITVNDRAAFARLGVVGKAPRGSVAYKFAAEQATTRVKDIQVSIGRTGAATPFAVLEPVVVAGSTIQMATLHNEGEVHRKDIRVGDTVIIQKAGDIIPEVVASLPQLRTGQEKVFKMPTKCPICSTKLVKTDKEAIWRCPNQNCYALERGRIIHFASKDAFDIEGLGEQTVDALLDSHLIADAADLYHLTVGDVAGMPRFAQLSATNLVNAISARKSVTLDRFIYGLGIRHVGQQTARDLAEHFGTSAELRAASLERLEEVEGIGKIVAQSVADWLASKAGQEFLDKLAREGVKAEPYERPHGKLDGLCFVITGTLESGSREQLEERIESLGGQPQKAVTKETDYLVVGADPGASKLTKAKQLGTKQIGEAELLELLG